MPSSQSVTRLLLETEHNSNQPGTHARDEEFRGRRPSHLEQFTSCSANRNSLPTEICSTSEAPPVWLTDSASEDYLWWAIQIHSSSSLIVAVSTVRKYSWVTTDPNWCLGQRAWSQWDRWSASSYMHTHITHTHDTLSTIHNTLQHITYDMTHDDTVT